MLNQLKNIKLRHIIHQLKLPCTWLYIFAIFGFKYIIISTIVNIIAVFATIILFMVFGAGASAGIEGDIQRYGGDSYAEYKAMKKHFK